MLSHRSLSVVARALTVAALIVSTPLAPSPAGAQSRPNESEFQVVVNASNPVLALEREELSRLFLKKVTSWSDGRAVMPVDRTEASPVRQAFTAHVHGRAVRAVKRYWQQKIFAGRAVPPVEKGTDAEVLEFVRANANGIGYVSAGASPGAGVRVIAVRP